MYLTRKVNIITEEISLKTLSITDSIQHFQYHKNENIISNVTYEKTHVPH